MYTRAENNPKLDNVVAKLISVVGLSKQSISCSRGVVDIQTCSNSALVKPTVQFFIRLKAGSDVKEPDERIVL